MTIQGKKKENVFNTVLIVGTISVLTIGLLWIENYVHQRAPKYAKKVVEQWHQESVGSEGIDNKNMPIVAPLDVLTSEAFNSNGAGKSVAFADIGGTVHSAPVDPVAEEKVWQNVVSKTLSRNAWSLEKIEKMRQYAPWVQLKMNNWRLIPGRSDGWFVGMDFTIDNTGNRAIKDVMLVCQSAGNSGSIIGVYSDVLYEKIGPTQSRTFAGVLRVGPVNMQTTQWSCKVGTILFESDPKEMIGLNDGKQREKENNSAGVKSEVETKGEVEGTNEGESKK